ncbi:hypothetical protein [Petroclostridium xylanilyticum]|uniref:Kae1-like domain-containing protein n=1 Tax=Petroclostridium xylanilyticum TaxID=1792311 RepID=UPI000B9935A1|nr:hypothetical protein [Petroclostridium xylanilyticum]
MLLSLGIDTSCYTTSIAVVDEKENLIANCRKLLSVKSGEKGLRQSDALFQHVKNLPELIEEIRKNVDIRNVNVISVSSKPRPVNDSYMPVFLSGIGFAKVIAETLQIPIKYYSHQEGHMMAGIWSAGVRSLLNRNFLSFHISGGTTELLYVNRIENGFDIKIIGGTRDLHAGQFIDRVGVSLGLPFPSGPYLEKMACEAEKKVRIPISTQDLWINFSGPETHAQRLISKGENPNEIALGVINCISVSIQRVLESAVNQTGVRDILMVGGVCSNKIMKEYLTGSFYGKANVYFAQPEFSTDNAVGIALLGLYNMVGSEVFK